AAQRFRRGVTIDVTGLHFRTGSPDVQALTVVRFGPGSFRPRRPGILLIGGADRDRVRHAGRADVTGVLPLVTRGDCHRDTRVDQAGRRVVQRVALPTADAHVRNSGVTGV